MRRAIQSDVFTFFSKSQSQRPPERTNQPTNQQTRMTIIAPAGGNNNNNNNLDCCLTDPILRGVPRKPPWIAGEAGYLCDRMSLALTVLETSRCYY